MKNVRKNRLSRQLLTATLLLGGTFNLVSPVLAQTTPTTTTTYTPGTTAGTQIRNQATATYEDPNAAGVSINATSNTVILTVAEVAGITNTPAGITDTSPSTPVITGDVLNYDYLITNVGNDATKIFIPGVVPSNNVTGGTAGTLQISVDGGSTYTNIPSAGFTTGSIAPGGSVKVRVPVTVSTTSGASVSVILGNTGTNDNSAGTQNQPYPTAPANNDVYTVDNTDGTAGETAGAPSNGEREASAVQSISVGAAPQAFATVLKTRTNYTNSGTVNTLNDDVLTYGLGLRVESTVPSGITGVVAANLVGTNINVDGSQVSRVLVSDAIPAGTKLRAAPTNVPSGWQAVYTADPLTTNANAANWSTTAPGNLTTVTRIGFINAGPVATNTSVTGLSFQLLTSGATGSTLKVDNIAQVFGQSENGGTVLVYDESGDQTPSNYNGNGTFANTPNNGVADPATQGVDTNNDNTGTGPGGEVNEYTITVAGDLVNGPNGQPGAVATTNNDDFTNKSTTVTAGTAPDGTINPDAVTFTNTVSNPGAATVSNVYVMPDDGTATGTLPTNTTVSLSYNNNTAVYTYNGTDFALTSGTPILIGNITAAGQISYTTSVDLPAGTTLSSTTSKPFAVPLRAFIDSNNNKTFEVGESNNITIDQLYTGYLKLLKEAQILSPSGQALTGYFTTPSATDAQQIQPGNIIQYRITYTNISSGVPQGGTGVATLRADKVVITEDGATAPNNWAIDQDKNNTIDTSNVVGSASDTAGTVTYYSGTSTVSDRTGTTPTTDVTKYLDTLNAPLNPGATGTFTFQRKINQ